MKQRTIYFVSYEVSEFPNAVDNIQWVFEQLAKIGEVEKFQSHACLVYTDYEAREIRDMLKVGIDCYDSLFVCAVKAEWAGFRTKLKNWIEPRRKDPFYGSHPDGAPAGSESSVSSSNVTKT